MWFNKIPKLFLFSRDGLMEMNVPPNSQLAASTKKAMSLANGSVSSREEQTAVLSDLIRQNNRCDLCHKCISEKKKRIAHRKICLIKYTKKQANLNNKLNGVLK